MVKVLSFRFQQSFGPFTMLLVKGSSKTGLLRHLSNHVFRSPYAQKYISHEAHAFFNMFKIKFKFGKCKKKKKMEKIFFVFEIIASEHVAKNCLS